MIRWFEEMFAFEDDIRGEIKITPSELAKQLSGTLKTITGLGSEISRVFKENWDLKNSAKPERFQYPELQEVSNVVVDPDTGKSKSTTEVQLKMISKPGRPFTVTVEMIESLNLPN